MRRALSVLGTVAAIALIPGFVLIIGLLAAYRYCFVRENKVTASTLRRIRANAARRDLAREIDEARIYPRTALDGPPTSALKRPWSERN
jgi:hypothetical protein